MSATEGCRNLSPSSVAPCTTIATIVDSERISCATRRSGPRPFSQRVPISNPTHTARLAVTSATDPAARLVIQNSWGLGSVAMLGSLRPLDKANVRAAGPPTLLLHPPKRAPRERAQAAPHVRCTHSPHPPPA